MLHDYLALRIEYGPDENLPILSQCIAYELGHARRLQTDYPCRFLVLTINKTLRDLGQFRPRSYAKRFLAEQSSISLDMLCSLAGLLIAHGESMLDYFRLRQVPLVLKPVGARLAKIYGPTGHETIEGFSRVRPNFPFIRFSVADKERPKDFTFVTKLLQKARLTSILHRVIWCRRRGATKFVFDATAGLNQVPFNHSAAAF